MTDNKEKALALIAAAQEKTKEPELLWCIAEDLKQVVQEADEYEAGIIATDLESGSHTLQSCEACVHSYADKHRENTVGVCPPAAVPGVLREHFGLPVKAAPAAADAEMPRPDTAKRLDIMDFFD